MVSTKDKVSCHNIRQHILGSHFNDFIGSLVHSSNFITFCQRVSLKPGIGKCLKLKSEIQCMEKVYGNWSKIRNDNSRNLLVRLRLTWVLWKINHGYFCRNEA